MPSALTAADSSPAAAKFQDPERTASGARRARVAFDGLRTLWFNTGTLCNLNCGGCYIESSPRNDRLVWLSLAEVREWLDDAAERGWPAPDIGFTGGEPFMNPEFLPMLRLCLGRGLRALVLTNAMRPMMKAAEGLLALPGAWRGRLMLRVSLDHYTAALHERERGPRSWAPALAGLQWLAAQDFRISVAGRTKWAETEAAARAGYAELFAELRLPLDAADPADLTLLPEMDPSADMPEITEACWSATGAEPRAMMCASSRMVIKRRGASRPALVPCTLLPYDARFDMGPSLARAGETITLNHPYCAAFCVLGGGSCSGAAGAGP